MLYVILDAQVAKDKNLAHLALEIEQAGADYIQYRDKVSTSQCVLENARDIKCALEGKAKFIINDSVSVAANSGADGVHLGQSDGSIELARKLLGKNAIIGRTCKTLEQCQTAFENGADYAGMGAVFATSTKTDTWVIDHSIIVQSARQVSMPVFAIGGINTKNCTQLFDAGIKNICVCAAVVAAPNPGQATAHIKELMQQCSK